MKVKIYAVRKYASREPKVHASVDGFRVFWEPRRHGWTCSAPDCDDIETCPHVTAVEELLAPSVLEGWLDDDPMPLPVPEVQLNSLRTQPVRPPSPFGRRGRTGLER